MTNKEYNKAKEECWKTVKKELDLHYWGGPTLDIVSHTFDYAYALGKQEKDADTVIQGWVCRDKKDNALNLHAEEPYRTYSHYNTDDKPDWWESDCASFLPLDNSLFPDLTWESDPQEVEIIIKRKKK